MKTLQLVETTETKLNRWEWRNTQVWSQYLDVDIPGSKVENGIRKYTLEQILTIRNQVPKGWRFAHPNDSDSINQDCNANIDKMLQAGWVEGDIWTTKLTHNEFRAYTIHIGEHGASLKSAPIDQYLAVRLVKIDDTPTKEQLLEMYMNATDDIMSDIEFYRLGSKLKSFNDPEINKALSDKEMSQNQ